MNYERRQLRAKRHEVSISQMQGLMHTRTTAEWIVLLEGKAVPCGPTNDISQAYDDARVKAHGLAVTLLRDAGVV